MQGAPAGLPSPFARNLAILLVLDAILLLPLLSRVTLWQRDEGRIAEVSKEMALTGDFVTPRLGGVPYACYPPLSYWLIAASGTLFGWNEFAMRLPEALAGLGLIAVLAWIGRRVAGAKAGLAAAMMLATLPGFFIQEKMCKADVLTTFFATLAFDRFLAWAESPEGSRRTRDLLFMYLAISLGVLAKGPIAIAMLGVGGLAWFVVRRRWKLLARMGWLWGIPLAAVVILPWYVLVYRALGPQEGPDFLRENLLWENVRAFTDGYQQAEPVYFYFTHAPPVMLPWVLVLALSWKVRRAAGLDLALGWLVAAFLFLSFSAAKRTSYVTYMQPALALASGIILTALCEQAPDLARRSLWVTSGLLASVAGVLFLVPRAKWTAERMVLIHDLFPALAAGALGGALLLALVTWRAGPAAGSTALAGVVAAGFLFYAAVLDPRFETDGRDGKAFCLRIREKVPAGQQLALMGTESFDGAFHFYYGTPLPKRRDEPPGYYLLIERQRSRLLAAGRKVREIDVVLDARKRPIYLAQVTD